MRYFVRRREASACILMLITKQGSHWYHFNAFGMTRPGFEPTTSQSRSGCSTTEPVGLEKGLPDSVEEMYFTFAWLLGLIEYVLKSL